MTDSNAVITAWLDRRCQHSARQFVEMHRSLVRRIVQRWLPNEQMIEDVIQETFIKAFKSMQRLTAGSNVSAWLGCIARNTSANYLRGWQRNIVRPATDCGIDDYNEMLVTSDKPKDEDSQTDQAIETLLSRLQKHDRNLLTLFHYEGRSARDVGQCLGLSEGNVRIRLMRSHRALRNHALSMRADGVL